MSRLPSVTRAASGAASAPAKASQLGATIAAMLALSVAMGFGRFAFTGMYPIMVRDHLLTVDGGSWAASGNYAGYLLGALLASRMPTARAAGIARIALVGTVLALLALALPMPTGAIIVIRLVAGVLSAFGLVAAAVWLFSHVGNHRGAPLLFAGVGVGILVSAEIIAGGNVAGWSSPAMWIALSVAAAAFVLIAWPALGRAYPQTGDAAAHHAGIPGLIGPSALIAAYGLAGYGYIVTATYLPLFIHDALGHIDPIHVWAAFGLGAAPSCFAWHAAHERFGTRRALSVNLLLQAFGVLLPVLVPSSAGYLGSAVLVGATFVGTTTIALSAARHVAHRVNFNLVAVLTAAYGIGQIAGPLASTALMSQSHSFTWPLVSAAGALVGAIVFCFL
ncbi:YbfB/YjiJ family MFS transporter [Cupriavidus plantarum]|uniref:Putative MFS-type transporter YbfB n=1 Tax=Cupriavidus plantarum TaxID=942865 RepID=A0A316ESU1_9BURK|nr:YbfB/YjiJ family MFS transporter [Cupriavidus plantarum]PWK34063.1 putative MFS-type transporter YbfB [Cupriavidus plantarum]